MLEHEYIRRLEDRIVRLEKLLGCDSTTDMSLIFEMAFSRKDYIQKVSGLVQQIVQNWCLCMYCKLHRPDLLDTYKHWRVELETHLSNLNQLKLKSGSRLDAVRVAFVDQNECDKPSQVLGLCDIKFRHENENRDNPLNMSVEHQAEVCGLCASQIMDIVECIVSDDITVYTRQTFPDTY